MALVHQQLNLHTNTHWDIHQHSHTNKPLLLNNVVIAMPWHNHTGRSCTDVETRAMLVFDGSNHTQEFTVSHRKSDVGVSLESPMCVCAHQTNAISIENSIVFDAWLCACARIANIWLLVVVLRCLQLNRKTGKNSQRHGAHNINVSKRH